MDGEQHTHSAPHRVHGKSNQCPSVSIPSPPPFLNTRTHLVDGPDDQRLPAPAVARSEDAVHRGAVVPVLGADVVALLLFWSWWWWWWCRVQYISNLGRAPCPHTHTLLKGPGAQRCSFPCTHAPTNPRPGGHLIFLPGLPRGRAPWGWWPPGSGSPWPGSPGPPATPAVVCGCGHRW